MTHLYIEQNTGLTEEVNSSIISKLYGLAISGDLDNTSDLKGRLHTNLCYRAQKEYLTTQYPNLHITSDDYSIPFEDPNIITYLNSIGVGSNGVITENQAAAATVVANSVNTTVTKFNELKYFTNITGSNGGFESSSYGKIQFMGWTSLEEVDVSNLTYIGHKKSNYAYPYDAYDTFDSCSSLKTVTASSNLTKLGYCAFSECSNLEYISGLSGEIELARSAFWHCEKLESRTFDNCVINITDGSVFESCNTITSLNISQQTTNITSSCFYNCTNLQTINGDNFSIIDRWACRNCENLVSIDLSNVTTIGESAFSWCTSLTSVNGNNSTPGVFNLPNVSTLGANAFVHCYGITQITGLNNVTTLPDSLFSECINLQSISLPNVITIGRQVFNGCQRLSNIDIDWDNVVSMSTGALKNCTGPFEYTGNTVMGGVSLFDGCTSATWPQEVTLTTDPGHRCFANCKLNKVIISPSVHSLCNTCFSGCSQLTEIRGLENITSIGAFIFENCQNLEGIIDLSNVTGYVNNSELNNNQNSQDGQMFKDCYKITKIIIGSLPQIEVLSANTPFRNNSMLEVVDISSLGHITIANGRTLFTNCPRIHSFILRSQTVVPLYAPSGYDYTFDLSKISDQSTIKVYVPDSLVNDYKQSSKWVDIQSCIYPISQFEIDHPTNTTT